MSSQRIYLLGGPGDGKFFEYRGGEFKLGSFDHNPLLEPEKAVVKETYYGFTGERLATGEMIFAVQQRTVIRP